MAQLFSRRALAAPYAGASLAALLAVAGQARAATDLHWLTPTSSTWEMMSNWTGGQIPNTNAFNAIIDASGAPYVVSYNSTFTLNDLALSASDASLTFSMNSTMTLQGNYTQGANMLTGFAGAGATSLSIAGDATFTGSAVTSFDAISTTSASSRLTFAGTNVTLMWIPHFNTIGELHFNANATDICDVEIGHGGSLMDWGPSAGNIRLGMNSTITNGATSTFMINNAATMGVIPGMGTGAFINNGMIKKASAGTTDFNAVALTNTAATGTVQVEMGTLRADTVSNFAAGALTGGKWKILNGATLDFASQAIQTNKADVTLSGAGSVFNAFTSNLNLNDTTGKVTIDTGRNLTTAGAFGNKGSVSVGSGSTFAVAPGQSFTSFNTGTNTLTEGVYDLKGKFQFTGANVVNLNADVTLDGAAAGMVNQSNANALLQSGVATNTIAAAGKLTIKNGVSFLTGGDLNVAQGGRLTIDTGTTFRVKPGSTFQNITPGGAFNNAGISLRGTLQADNANVNLIGAGGSFTLDGSTSMLLNGAGMDGFSALNRIDAGQFTVTAGRALTVTPATFNLRGAGGALNIGPRGNLDSGADAPRGVQSIITATGDFLMEDGDLTIDDGILRIQGAGGFTHTGGNVTLLNGGRIEIVSADPGATPHAMNTSSGSVGGEGTIVGSHITIAGAIRPGSPVGTLNITGDATLTAPSSLEIEFTSAAAWDHLAITGALDFSGLGGSNEAGTLRVLVGPGFDAAMGSIFEVVSAGSRDGTFADYEGLYFAPGKAFAPVYAFGSMYLEVVPAPGAASLLALGAALRRRRR